MLEICYGDCRIGQCGAPGLNFKRASAAPPGTTADKPDPKEGGKKICYEFKKSGSCKKGADCAYEHVAAAVLKVNKTKREKSPKKTAAPVIVMSAPALTFHSRLEPRGVLSGGKRQLQEKC